MESDQPSPSMHHWTNFAVAIAAGLCTGVIAALPQSSGMFLVGLQSLAAGALLSVLLVGGTAMFGTSRPRWPSALVAAAVAVVAQHVWLYRLAMARRQDAAAREPAVEMFRPGWTDQGFFEYMQSEATTSAMLLWALDACLLALAAVVIVELSSRWRITVAHEQSS